MVKMVNVSCCQNMSGLQISKNDIYLRQGSVFIDLKGQASVCVINDAAQLGSL